MNYHLEELNKILEDQKWTIYRLREQVQHTIDNSLYVMTDEERERHNSFTHRHYLKCHNLNHFVYEIFDKDGACHVTVACPKCNELEDLTI